MAGRLTLWGAGQLLRSFFGRTAEPPQTFYLALIKDIAPTPYVSGAELDEPDVETGYQRVAIPNDAASWTASEGFLHITSNAIDLPFITAITDWGSINYWAVCNAEVDGYVYFVGSVEQADYVAAGDQVVMGTDELVIELGPFYTDEDF